MKFWFSYEPENFWSWTFVALRKELFPVELVDCTLEILTQCGIMSGVNPTQSPFRNVTGSSNGLVKTLLQHMDHTVQTAAFL
jgi:hypothetical protein